MATINFKTQELANLYAYGTNAANAGHLDYFRNNTNEALKSDISALDQRIANFQNVITDAAKAGSEDFPYDKEFLKREFMEEVFAIMLKRPEYRRPDGLSIPNGPFTSFTTSVAYSAGGQDLLQNRGTIMWNGAAWSGNFSDMTADQHKAVLASGLGDGGIPVYDAYSAWIDAVFAEGNKMKLNPQEKVTVVTSITPRTLPTANSPHIVYDRVATVNSGIKDAQGNPVFEYYLIAENAPVSGLNKVSVAGTLSGQPVDSKIELTTNPAVETSIYIQVTKELQPLQNNAFGFVNQVNNLSPAMYLYYFMEARIRVLRGQLNMKEAVTSEIRDDLAKANSAYADLEAQAGKTRAQSENGKTTNPDLSYETQNMDFFEATNAKKGLTIFENNGNDDQANYTEWGSSRSSLKSYIDRKSTQSQDAMLDYQTTLNRFNQAYEVMSKIQEKMDGLVKSQLRNVS
ncbi:hypothetical protein [Prosthecobacter dejongeii]|uniref:Uncharacterized protein n=1 Tax=Prosthecobacter dejongeii TaxID=48465 RepID=A0A7W7YKE2_9BACT|nr:hypothetical protein [Prosthecobacter dejongeii]MBB5037709.1 hypothetical protein [Prosthecobacter dejongeii]